MTVPPRGARNRRNGRRPGWPLLTALLVLAILASATLVFTARVELLRLAVILSLWAAVLAAFVSVIYRRQSEADHARARDMKLVYDLQLDREISARREYELNVEAHLRRQLSKEARAQAADEVAALRAELAALRTNLEVMFGADLGLRPALEAEPVLTPIPAAPGRVHSSRVTPVAAESVATGDDASAITDNPIIDVPEEPLTPPAGPAAPPQADARTPEYGGSRRQPQQEAPPAPPTAPWRPPETSQGRHRTAEQPGAAVRQEPAVAAAQPDPASGRSHPGVPVPPAGRHRPPAEVPETDPVPEAAGAPEIDEDAEPSGQHTGGQSLAELMAKLQVSGPVGGGRRRRRED